MFNAYDTEVVKMVAVVKIPYVIYKEVHDGNKKNVLIAVLKTFIKMRTYLSPKEKNMYYFSTFVIYTHAQKHC